ncbi:unnamed protein product [Caenorhabditis bovis]|uniref:Uncharacterized protein n=1 Tax=Caenorhabditis bovis TaxID=2654633 RepID=A0A8S1E8Y5_9PELO|nr:unnamed protein product [Caenorhabditis bovis]
MDSFRFYLLYFQICCLLADVQMTFLMQPIPLFPICAGFSTGILAENFALRSLIFQASVTPILIVPCLFVMLFLVTEYRGAQEWSRIMLIIIVTHSSINAVVMISSFPEYRKFFLSCKVVGGVVGAEYQQVSWVCSPVSGPVSSAAGLGVGS